MRSNAAHRRRTIAPVVVLLALVAAPRPASAQSASPACRGSGGHRSASSINSGNDNDVDSYRTIQIVEGDCELMLRSRGDVTVTPMLDDITAVAPNGWVEIEERSGDTVRRLEIRQHGGALVRRYTLNGDADNFDVDKRAWLSGVLVAMERRTGAFAKTRIPALLQQGGPDAVLREIPLLEGDYARSLYLTTLLKQPSVDDKVIDQALATAESSMSSDYERGQVLQAVAARRTTMSDRVAAAYVRAASKMSSDYEKRRALVAAISSGAAAHARPALYDAAASISSDYERSELLIAAERAGGVDGADRDPYFRAVGKFSSDYERRRTLSTLLAEHPKDADVLRGILQASNAMSSDYDKAELLLAFARVVPLQGDLRDAFVAASKHIQSDYEYRRVLQAVVNGKS